MNTTLKGQKIKRTLFIAVTLTIVSLGAWAQNVNIPDANFKAYLVGNSAINTNSDTEIQVSEAAVFTGTINCSGLSIADMTGVGAFSSLTELRCSANDFTSLDLSGNVSLITLFCNQSPSLLSINLSQNVNLESLYLTDNTSMGDIDVSQNTALVNLDIQGNNANNLNVSSNIHLEVLNCPFNFLSTLDVSQNTALTYLGCAQNPSLTALDVSNNLNLTHLYAQANTNLSSLNMKNLSTSILTNFSAVSNPNLTCIEVDDVAAAEANWTNIDATASFSLKCTVDIPDAAFKAYLAGNSSINTNGDAEIQTSEATAFTGQINCQNLNIADLAGIEAFTALTGLLCGNNQLTAIDLSQNTALTTFQCQNNNLTSLDLTQNTALTNFVSVNNNLTSLDLSQNVDLGLLSISDNNIASIDLSQNTNLTILMCSNNALSSLDVSANTQLQNFNCSNNSLTALNMRNISTSTLGGFDATSNPNLTCIEVDDIQAATATWTNIDATASFCGGLVSTIDVQGQGGATAITTNEGTLQMEATVSPANADDATYVWSVTNGTGAATIDANGLLMAVSNGTVTVTATANDGSEITGDVTITISNQVVLSINDQQKNREWVIYPNPVTSVLNLDFNTTIEAISIVDFTGKPIKTIPSPKRVFDVSDLAIGIYFFQIKTDQGLMSKKFVKQ
ncbi:T9SS type A sorting domain-containing protein [Reichenbachiella carrageenanivorans]|uniref:T9SS type A sorting domain-containing protein n=1 Tax=Reichenbachiella carrageenanivorans TaxID=2979869 RepID=A0ABY6D1A3_9BACT|nr:T9SS type A sorting domain-containing protein [Reichenbachiella carrageenanivorans]UXX79942.1 T9SS type A sorting domain-containing protein [Reichenbachiella carrageenanivorans]